MRRSAFSRSVKLNAYGYDLGDFVFRITSEEAEKRKRAAANEIDLAFWKSASKEGTELAYQAYIQKFPKGTFLPLARMKLNEFKRIRAAKLKQLEELEKAHRKAKSETGHKAEADARRKAEAASKNDPHRKNNKGKLVVASLPPAMTQKPNEANISSSATKSWR